MEAKRQLKLVEVPKKEVILRALDKQIATLSQGLEVKNGTSESIADRSFRENYKKYLISLRLGISGMNAKQSIDFSPSSYESLNRIMTFMDTPKEKRTPDDLILYAADAFNVARYGASDAMGICIAMTRDMTTNRLHKMGGMSEADIAIEKGLDTTKLPDFLKQFLFNLGKGSFAMVAGGLDGTLDYLQASVDTMTIPDRVIQNAMNTIGDMGSALYKDNKQFFDGIGKVVSENVTNQSDVLYIMSYIIAVIACIVYFPPPAGLLALPVFLAKQITKFCSMFQLGKTAEQQMLQIVEQSSIAKTVKKHAVGKSEETFDKTSTVDTGTQRLSTNASRDAELARTNALLKSVTSTQILTHIFGDKIMPKLNATGDVKDLTNKSEQGYVEALLQPNGYQNLESLCDAIGRTTGETQYNLLKTYEKFVEIREVMEKEVLPVLKRKWKSFGDSGIVGGKTEYMIYIEKVKKNLPNMSELGRTIIQETIINGR